MTDAVVSLLLDRVKETAAWCESRIFAASSTVLRSPELQPSLRFAVNHFHGDVLSEPREIESCSLESVEVEARVRAVEELAYKRRELLAQRGIEVRVSDEEWRKGRLLFYNPALNHLYSGLPEVASDGFFDTENSPPWDTWLCYVQSGQESKWHHFLIAWVPKRFLAVADAGIQTDAELDRCIVWADEVDAQIARSASKNPLGQQPH